MKTILLVEDDAGLRECFTEILTGRGYEVTAARDGLEAIYKYSPCTFDFILTDYQMPRWNGEELLLCIRFLNSAQKMILMSADPPVLKPEVSDVPVLTKPFKIEDLVKILEGE